LQIQGLSLYQLPLLQPPEILWSPSHSCLYLFMQETLKPSVSDAMEDCQVGTFSTSPAPGTPSPREFAMELGTLRGSVLGWAIEACTQTMLLMVGHLWVSNPSLESFFFFFFCWDWGWNSGL
jgi:hypothetical protein